MGEDLNPVRGNHFYFHSMPTKFLIVLMVCVVTTSFTGCATVEQPVIMQTSDMGQRSEPYEILKSAQIFAIGGIGYSGAISEEEKAFRSLLHQNNASEQCLALLSNATSEGQLFALLGLKLLDEGLFRQKAQPYLESDATVTTMRGCIRNRESVAFIAGEIQEGSYR